MRVIAEDTTVAHCYTDKVLATQQPMPSNAAASIQIFIAAFTKTNKTIKDTEVNDPPVS